MLKHTTEFFWMVTIGIIAGVALPFLFAHSTAIGVVVSVVMIPLLCFAANKTLDISDTIDRLATRIENRRRRKREKSDASTP